MIFIYLFYYYIYSWRTRDETEKNKETRGRVGRSECEEGAVREEGESKGGREQGRERAREGESKGGRRELSIMADDEDDYRFSNIAEYPEKRFNRLRYILWVYYPLLKVKLPNCFGTDNEWAITSSVLKPEVMQEIFAGCNAGQVPLGIVKSLKSKGGFVRFMETTIIIDSAILQQSHLGWNPSI